MRRAGVALAFNIVSRSGRVDTAHMSTGQPRPQYCTP